MIKQGNLGSVTHQENRQGNLRGNQAQIHNKQLREDSTSKRVKWSDANNNKTTNQSSSQNNDMIDDVDAKCKRCNQKKNPGRFLLNDICLDCQRSNQTKDGKFKCCKCNLSKNTLD